ncbi:MAG: hypothetical protein JW822_09720 [Spirochaetales bacterium]|nr:hypothetical protein [Spirochaetales bacterium]
MEYILYQLIEKKHSIFSVICKSIAAATLDDLIANGLCGCLQARLLQAGRTARVVDIMQIDNPDVVKNVLVRSFAD